MKLLPDRCGRMCMHGLIAGAALAVATTAGAAELRSPTLALTLRDGVVVELRNRLTGESFVTSPEHLSLPAGLHRLGEPFLKFSNAIETATPRQAVQSFAASSFARMELRAEIEPATGDVLITQTAEAAHKKLVGVAWSLADIPNRFDVLVPGGSGQRFSSDSPPGRREFDYPITWEASFVLIQGRRGGLLIRSEDEPPRFKHLTLEHDGGAFRLRFESRNLAPFQDKDRIQSVRWRITPYRGPWQTGAALYRRWAEAHRPLTPLAQQQPAWVRDIRFVVTVSLDAPLLVELARQCHPGQTLLYVPNWRRDGYDRNYPDYTAVTNFDAFVTEAHRLGFRVMAHVNYFGCQVENPAYERVRHAHLRDPFSGELLWWEWPAKPPIKFAYINPASRAWRELFVERMKELVRRHRVDALHLDVSLGIFNDANGLVDGMTCIEGNLALHRELRAALPDVALSGEGLNEITCQYEAFAQRHIWGMDHINDTWDERAIAMSHPISSAVFAPYTHLYGYLGTPNPANTRVWSAWCRAYQPLGVLPTYTRFDAAQLAHPPPTVAELLARARFFQQHQPVPDFDAPWGPRDIFVYRLADGGRAVYRRDRGVAFGRLAPTPTRPIRPTPDDAVEILSRRIEGVSAVRLDGSIPGWPAYDARRIFGLDPQQSYVWSPAPRDLRAPRIAALSDNIAIEQAGVHADFARFRLRQLTEPGRIALWDFRGDVTAGVRFADGTTRTANALHFEDEASAATTRPQGEGFFLHPPWKGSERNQGRPVTFLEFNLRLPRARPLAFESGVGLGAGAEGKSDGVTFRVIATRGQLQRIAELHHDRADAKPLRLDLSEFSGARVRLRLEADAGPKNEISWDWALFQQPRVVVETNAPPSSATIRFAGLKPGAMALFGTNAAALRVESDGTAQVQSPVPGALIIAIKPPATVLAPCDLLATPFTSQTALPDGIETAAPADHGAIVTTARVGGDPRRALEMQPPRWSRLFVSWLVRLPDAPARLLTAVGVPDDMKTRTANVEIQINGQPVFTTQLQPDSGWQPVEVDLGRWRGQPILLTCVADRTRGPAQVSVAWAEPRLEPAPAQSARSHAPSSPP
ncbi:MAG: DUF6259 domain-containing protein [Verrucomicrobiales bacterium]|nr:DUF6259 domain-containing protein [Verrucomicrobiales bacterium]